MNKRCLNPVTLLNLQAKILILSKSQASMQLQEDFEDQTAIFIKSKIVYLQV